MKTKADALSDKPIDIGVAVLTELRALRQLLLSGLVPSDYLTLTQAAAYVHAAPSTVREWMRTKGLPYYKPGKELLFRMKDLDAWMNRYRRGDHGLALHRFNRSL